MTIESSGFDKRPVTVELREGEVVHNKKDIVLRDGEQQQIELTFKATKPGTHYFTVNVPVQPEEPQHLQANNSESVFVRVSDERLKVLYIEGRASWDFRFLKNAIRRDNGIGGLTVSEFDLVGSPGARNSTSSSSRSGGASRKPCVPRRSRRSWSG